MDIDLKLQSYNYDKEPQGLSIELDDSDGDPYCIIRITNHLTDYMGNCYEIKLHEIKELIDGLNYVYNYWSGKKKNEQS